MAYYWKRYFNSTHVYVRKPDTHPVLLTELLSRGSDTLYFNTFFKIYII